MVQLYKQSMPWVEAILHGAFARCMIVVCHLWSNKSHGIMCANVQGAGFDLELVSAVSNAVGIPVIASSGAGSPEHFSAVFDSTKASAALAAGIFHRKEVGIHEVKEHIRLSGIPVRMS